MNCTAEQREKMLAWFPEEVRKAIELLGDKFIEYIEEETIVECDVYPSAVDIYNAISMGVFNSCGCGSADDNGKYIVKQLKAADEIHNFHCPDGSLSGPVWQKYCENHDKLVVERFHSKENYLFFLYIVDSLGLMDHGSSVYSAHLSDTGKAIITVGTFAEQLEKDRK